MTTIFYISCLFAGLAVINAHCNCGCEEKEFCPCSEKCTNSDSRSSGRGKLREKISCLSGFVCNIVPRKDAEQDGCAYASNVIECRSVCEDVKCPCGKSCKLLRAKHCYNGSEEFYNVPHCGENPCDSYKDNCKCYETCQLKIKNASRLKYGDPCKVEPYCENACDSFCCPDDTYCAAANSDDCKIAPCPVDYECVNPCDKITCPAGQTCKYYPDSSDSKLCGQAKCEYPNAADTVGCCANS